MVVSKRLQVFLFAVLMSEAHSLLMAPVFAPVRPAMLHSGYRRIPLPVIASSEPSPDPEEVTKKFGLEAGLLSIFRRQGKSESDSTSSMSQAKSLLKQYGGAYLLTSTSLAVVSFSLCYFAVDNGIDVSELLQRVGITVSTTSETAGTVGIAYAIHKAASPIRFPPTVALTPIVARKLFGQMVADDAAGDGKVKDD